VRFTLLRTAILRPRHRDGGRFTNWRVSPSSAGRGVDLAIRYLEHQAITEWWDHQAVVSHADSYKDDQSVEDIEQLDRERARLLEVRTQIRRNVGMAQQRPDATDVCRARARN
jgi:hypothetical protein